MVNLRFKLHCAFDRVGNKAILFRFLDYPSNSSKILNRRDHDSRLNYDLGYLIIASRHFLQPTLGCRRETEQGYLGIFRDGEERKHKAGV